MKTDPNPDGKPDPRTGAKPETVTATSNGSGRKHGKQRNSLLSKSPTPAVRRRMEATDPAHRAPGGAVGQCQQRSALQPRARQRKRHCGVVNERAAPKPGRPCGHVTTQSQQPMTLTSEDAQKTCDDEEAEPASARCSRQIWSNAIQGQGTQTDSATNGAASHQRLNQPGRNPSSRSPCHS